jgi:hypothetical protein
MEMSLLSLLKRDNDVQNDMMIRFDQERLSEILMWP